jgi:RecB family endonuclease NucS
MYEADLTRALILNPNFIEAGLTFKGREVVLSGKRCDLLFEDKIGNNLYVEVK